MNAVTPQQIQELRQDHIGRLLLRTYRQFADTASHKLQARGHQISASAIGLIAHIDLNGTRASELAERAGISKQAIGVLITELETAQYVQRQPDNTDGRASIITFTEQGWGLLQDAFEIKKEIESNYENILGKHRMSILRGALRDLLESEEK
jgi:DNA-binding MarR family transcriptional regulator